MMMRIINLIAGSGTPYYVTMGVEGAVALIAAVFLILLLANVFAKREEKQTEPQTALVAVDTPAETWSDTEAAPIATVADETPVTIVREINTVYVPVEVEKEVIRTVEVEKEVPVIVEQEPKVVEAEPIVEEPAPVVEPVSAPTEEAKEKKSSIIINVFNAPTEEAKAEPAPVEAEDDNKVSFAESKTIEELYDELSVEQKSFFDELKNTALAKPNAVLSVTKNYENVKIGKRSIIKLLIRRGVTVAEFILENDALKEYRLSGQNKKGKSKIKVRPTVLAVTELDTLKAAVDMIHLAYEQIIEE